jgi:hypothetical protein
MNTVQEKYVEHMALSRAKRGDCILFEVHKLPGVTDEDFMKIINKYGLTVELKIFGIDGVLVKFNWDNEYAKTQLYPVYRKD